MSTICWRGWAVPRLRAAKLSARLSGPGRKHGEEVDARRAVIGLEPGQSFERAPCCEPLPGERIVGITFRGRGVTVHAIDCDRLSAYEDQPERWFDLRWHDGSHPAVYGATIDMTIGNDAGVLGRICT